MKRTAFVWMLTATAACFAQWDTGDPSGGGTLDAGLGMTWIDNQSFYTVSFQPDIRIGKFGIGLGIQLLYNTETGRLRTRDWNTSADYARLIRYLRYGKKGDRVYTRAGALDAERLGHGFILTYYNNQLNYDERKIGLVLDIDFGRFGFESLTNNLGRTEVFAGRLYYRPFYASPIPVISHFAIGASAGADVDPDAWKGSQDDRVVVWGADVEFPLIKGELLDVVLYADYARIDGYGGGKAVGIRTDLEGLSGLLTVGIHFERRFLGDRFIAGYFGPFYEMLRYTTASELVDFYVSLGGDSTGIPGEYLPVTGAMRVSQKVLLPMMNRKRTGWYAGLYADVLHLIRVMGAFQIMDGEDAGGVLHAGAALSPQIPFLAAEACYDKRGIGTFRDIRTLDYRSLARVGIGYKITPFLLFYLDYLWSFRWDEELGRFRPQERFQPRLAFRYHF